MKYDEFCVYVLSLSSLDCAMVGYNVALILKIDIPSMTEHIRLGCFRCYAPRPCQDKAILSLTSTPAS